MTVHNNIAGRPHCPTCAAQHKTVAAEPADVPYPWEKSYRDSSQAAAKKASKAKKFRRAVTPL